ncbi:MAG: RpiB/LacA/LacB family sugar-phosphate isomerase [Candidatus Omnitrophica bacterium]|nr:RpiB/LacA/LacB family sugar-phosphate isomerase [Candidatus Omnitrophota bacterium]
MKIAIGTDHGGFSLKALLIRRLKAAGHRAADMGTMSPEPCDYPLIGAKVAEAVSRGRARLGVLLCKSGGGMAIVANKFPGVRAVVCETVSSAHHAREHNNANILVLGAEGLSSREAVRILQEFLKTPFAGGRHARRIRQITQIEKQIRRTFPHV